MLGIHETNIVCQYVGVLASSDIIALCVITFPKHTGGAPHLPQVLLLGIGSSGGSGSSGGLEEFDESFEIGESRT